MGNIHNDSRSLTHSLIHSFIQPSIHNIKQVKDTIEFKSPQIIKSHECQPQSVVYGCPPST